MKSVGLRELNQHLSRHLKSVKAGEEILITERGAPFALIKPVRGQQTLEDRIRQAEIKGLLVRAEAEGALSLHPMVSAQGVPLSQTVSEIRDER